MWPTLYSNYKQVYIAGLQKPVMNEHDKTTAALHVEGFNPLGELDEFNDQASAVSRSKSRSLASMTSAASDSLVSLFSDDGNGSESDRQEFMQKLRALRESIKADLRQMPRVSDETVDLMQLFNETHHTIFRSRFYPGENADQCANESGKKERESKESEVRRKRKNDHAGVPLEIVSRTLLSNPDPNIPLSAHLANLRIRQKQLLVERYKLHWTEVRPPQHKWWELADKNFGFELRKAREMEKNPYRYEECKQELERLYRREVIDRALMSAGMSKDQGSAV